MLKSMKITTTTTTIIMHLLYRDTKPEPSTETLSIKERRKMFEAKVNADSKPPPPPIRTAKTRQSLQINDPAFADSKNSCFLPFLIEKIVYISRTSK